MMEEEKLRRAWEAVVERYGVLRSEVVWEGVRRAQQVVKRRGEVEMEVEDWRAMGEQEQEERREEYLRRDRERGFDLRKGPLMRVMVWRLGEERWGMVWSYHHVVMDGWSTPIVLGEVLERYEEGRRGQEEQRRERVREYGEYIEWLERQSEGEAEGYWRRELGGVEEPTGLGIERVGREGGEVSRYEEETREWSEEETEGLVEWSRRQEVTLNTLVLGAWAVVLSHYSGQDEVVFGTVVAGRPTELEGVESMVGLFINTLPVRVEVRGEEEVGGWLREVQGRQVEMRQYEYSSLVQVQGWSGVPRGVPLFESVLVLDSYPRPTAYPEAAAEAGLRLDAVPSIEQTKYPPTL